jgi:hypothetical protein
LKCASRTIPLGTAYAVWGGIGALGTCWSALLCFDEPATDDPAAPHLRADRLHSRLKLTA